MEDTLISFQVAKLAKEKGFKLGSGWQIRSLFNIKDGKTFCEKAIETPEHACERCSQSLLQKWLREKHKIIVAINIMSDLSYYSLLVDINENKLNLKHQSKNREFNIYEEALEDGLQEALKLN